MNHPTLGLLEKLRPPSGFRTEAALGTSYSVDLLTCMAVLTTMDGGDGEQVRYGRIEAYRALDRLRDKVRICYQAGRISRRDGSKYPSLALLDRILIPVGVSGRGSFHPKVWIVRQIDDAKRERFMLVVSSRNITTSTDWDLGIALEGQLGGNGIHLPRVREFAEHVLALADDRPRLESLGDLDEVRWARPAGIRELAFDFQPGGADHGALHRVWSTFPSRGSRVLLLSPFLDGGMVKEAATRFRGFETRRLVAGTNELIEVALGSQRASLTALEPREVAPAVEAPDEVEPESDDNGDEREATRPLHAKVIAIDERRRTTIVLGSNNLTGMGWCDGSTEAFVRLVGDLALSEPLWDWAGKYAYTFELPEPGTEPPEQPVLERVKDALHRTSVGLDDQGSESSRLTMDPAPVLPADVSLHVARYTVPQETTPFPSGRDSIEIPSCSSALRTRFVVCTLHYRGEYASWIAMADLKPPIADERDRELVARLLGLREFLAYLQSINDEESIPGTVEGEREEPDRSGRRESSGAIDGVHLEGLLRQLARNPNGFAEMNRTIERYGALIEKQAIPASDNALLRELLAAWAAIREGFSP